MKTVASGRRGGSIYLYQPLISVRAELVSHTRDPTALFVVES